MGRKKQLKDFLFKFGILGVIIYSCINRMYYFYVNRGGDRKATIRAYKKIYGKAPNIDNPHTLNEWILWLKLNDRTSKHTLCADKFTVREYLKDKFGDEVLIPLLYETDNVDDVTYDVIPDVPCIIKSSHTQGDMVIIKDKEKLDFKRLKFEMKIWMKRNLYYETKEWQYKNCKPRIIIEKLLQDKNDYIPNDYKLHYINGKLEFVYCSIGRETVNKRNIYDSDWNPLYFSWVEPAKDLSNIRGEEIEAPASFEQMKIMGAEIAKLFNKYVRVDFYDVDGHLYFGEITFHHGGGFDVFVPESFDEYYGSKIK